MKVLAGQSVGGNMGKCGGIYMYAKKENASKNIRRNRQQDVKKFILKVLVAMWAKSKCWW